MAYMVSTQSKAAPVWVDGIVYEVSAQNTGGISAAGSSHFDTRSACLDVLKAMITTETGTETLTQLPWVVGYQKVQPLSRLDF
jgi:hypothetical protein